MRKITAVLPADILDVAQANSGQGLAQTLRTALERYNHSEWCARMLALEGKVKLDLDLDELRADREFDPQGNVI